MIVKYWDKKKQDWVVIDWSEETRTVRSVPQGTETDKKLFIVRKKEVWIRNVPVRVVAKTEDEAHKLVLDGRGREGPDYFEKSEIEVPNVDPKDWDVELDTYFAYERHY